MKRTIASDVGNSTVSYIVYAQMPTIDNQSGTFQGIIRSSDKTFPEKRNQPLERVVDDAEGKTDTSTDSKALLSESSEMHANRAEISFHVDEQEYLSSLLMEEVCESGIRNPSEEYFRTLLKNNRLNALNIISMIFYQSFSTDNKKANTLVSILHMLSHLEYDQVYPIGQLLAISAIGHKHKEVAEFGIKCFENWENPDCITHLQAIAFSTSWLQDYADQVIADLSEV